MQLPMLWEVMTMTDREDYIIRWSRALSRIGYRNLTCLPATWLTLLKATTDLVRKTILLESIADALHR